MNRFSFFRFSSVFFLFLFLFQGFLLAVEDKVFWDKQKNEYEKLNDPFPIETEFWWKSPVSLSPSEMYYHSSFFSRRLSHYNLSTLLSELDDYAIYQLEAVADFSFLEGHVYSVFGNSWRWNTYEVDHVDVTDPFFSGRLLHFVEPIAQDVHFRAEDGKVLFRTRPISHFSAKGWTSFAGGALPYWKGIKQASNHKPAQLRNPPPTTVRRGQTGATEVNFQHVVPFYGFMGNLGGMDIINVIFTYQKRFHLQFNERGFDGRFYEQGYWGSFHYERKYDPSTFNSWKDFAFGFFVTGKYRDKLYSDFYYRDEETAKLLIGASTVYVRLSKYDVHALSISVHDIKPNNLSSAGNLLRLGGEGIDPYYPSMTYVTLKFDQKFRSFFKNSKPMVTGALGYVNDDYFSFDGKFNNIITIGKPKVTHWEKPIYFRSFENEQEVFRPLYVMNFRSESIYYALFDNSLGVAIGEEEKEAKGFRYFLFAGIDVDGMVVDPSYHNPEKNKINNSFANVSPYTKMGVEFLDPKLYRIRLEFGRENIPFTSAFALFLTPGHAHSNNFLWKDGDGDQKYSSDEASNKLHSTWGSSEHRLSRPFRQPHYYYFSSPFNFLLPENVVLSFSLHYRIFKDQPWVSFDGNGEDYGSYKKVGDKEVFIRKDGKKKYVVGNLAKERFPHANFFNDSPFYAGATLKVGWHNKVALVSVSFSAYLINSITWLGNGPLNNSLGVLDEAMADDAMSLNPNRTLGRLDADRAYVVRILYAQKFHRYFFASLGLTYRDGQPFGAWSYHLSEEDVRLGSHVGWVREKVNGDNILLYKGEFGQREDAIWNLDLRFLGLVPLPGQKESLEIYLIFYNLIDLALEVLEYTSYAEKIKNRAALDTQHPRAIELGFRYSF